MFIVSQDGKHVVNTDHIAEITTATPAPCIVAVTKTNKRIILATYAPQDEIVLLRELDDCIRYMSEEKPVYFFPYYAPSEEK